MNARPRPLYGVPHKEEDWKASSKKKNTEKKKRLEKELEKKRKTSTED